MRVLLATTVGAVLIVLAPCIRGDAIELFKLAALEMPTASYVQALGPWRDGALYSVETAESGRELWLATETRLEQLVDLVPGAESSGPYYSFNAPDGSLYFAALGGVYKLNHPGAEAELFFPVDYYDGVKCVDTYGGAVFIGTKKGLWVQEPGHPPPVSPAFVSDTGIVQLHHLNGNLVVVTGIVPPDSAGGWPGSLYRWGGDQDNSEWLGAIFAYQLTRSDPLLFGDYGGLNFTDGTAAGTGSFPRYDRSSFPARLPSGKFLFGAENYDDENGYELYSLEGHTLEEVKDISPGSASSSPIYFAILGDMAFFSAATSVNGRELWKSDGTGAGTGLLRDIRGGSASSSPQQLSRIGSRIFFSANNGALGRELWVTNGTGEGTKIIKDIHPSGDSSPVLLAISKGWLVFTATSVATGTELWVSRGTPETTRPVDVEPGEIGSSLSNFVYRSNAIFFMATKEGAKSIYALKLAPENVADAMVAQELLIYVRSTQDPISVASLRASYPGLDDQLVSRWDADLDQAISARELLAGARDDSHHDLDKDRNHQISLPELLRAIQFYNLGGYQCDFDSWDGFGGGEDEARRDCLRHSGDYLPFDWTLSLQEVLRVVQFFNSGGYRECPGTEDGYCAGS